MSYLCLIWLVKFFFWILFVEYFVAMYSYNSNEPGDLSFNQGDIITVTKAETDWWTGTLGEKSGIFPANYVKKMETQVVIYHEKVKILSVFMSSFIFSNLTSLFFLVYLELLIKLLQHFYNNDFMINSQKTLRSRFHGEDQNDFEKSVQDVVNSYIMGFYMLID